MSAPRVETSAGPVEGTAEAGYQRYLGIPYAKAPVGELRFGAPQPPEPWADVLVASRFGPHSPQPPSPMEGFLNNGAAMVVDEANCLRLNVWTPAADSAARPVMVWIHGGAFVSGTSATAWYDGAAFARDHDVVLVSLNYRLGALGFTYLGELDAELGGSGSLGVQDAAAALRWVRDNIAHFGGDPANVTIFGESAGAMSVGTLLALPEASGLFHRAILQSGAASNVVAPEVAAERARELLGAAGVATVAELRAAPLERVLEAQQKVAADHVRDGLVFAPVVDGQVLPRSPLEAVRAGSAAGVDILIGTNLDEWRLFGLMDPTFGATDDDALVTAVDLVAPGRAEAIVAAYRAGLADAPPPDVRSRIISDSAFRIPAVRLAEAQVEAGGRAWMYLFSWPSPQLGGALGSCHALELPFVFNTLDQPGASFLVGDNPPRHLARDMNATWAAFARHGDPARGAFGDWPDYEPATRATMVLDAEPRLEKDPYAAERRAWED